jgi:hypothetical protein
VSAAFLAALARLTDRVCRKALDLAIWLFTEADGKYRTRFRSVGALEVNDPRPLNHEHVLPKRVLIDRLVAEPDRCDEILRSAVAYTVLREEHDGLNAAERSDPTLDGWGRYRAAGITVVDLASGAPLETDRAGAHSPSSAYSSPSVEQRPLQLGSTSRLQADAQAADRDPEVRMTSSGPDHQPSLVGEHDDAVEAAIVQAGPLGVELVDLEQATRLRYRVLHNVTYRLEQQGRAFRISNRPVRYVAK